MREPGFNGDVEVVGRDACDAVHTREVDRNTAVEGVDVAFEGAPHTEWDDRHPGRGARRHDRRNFFSAGGIRHRVGRCGGVPRLAVAVVVAHRFGRREPVTQQRVQLLEQSR